MKRTKQAAAVLTALALAASMALPVWAETPGTDLIDSTTLDSKATCEVTATYNPAEVIHVDIEWGDMTFTYEPGTWTPEYTAKNDSEQKATYTGTNSGWNNKTANSTIKMTNKSNANLKVKFDYTADSDYTSVTGGFYVKKDANSVTYDTKVEDKGIWMQRADANVTGVAIDTGATGKNPDITNEQVGQATTAEVKLILTGRPQKRIENSSKIGTVTVTVESVDYNEVPEDNSTTYSKIYKQSTT